MPLRFAMILPPFFFFFSAMRAILYARRFIFLLCAISPPSPPSPLFRHCWCRLPPLFAAIRHFAIIFRHCWYFAATPLCWFDAAASASAVTPIFFADTLMLPSLFFFFSWCCALFRDAVFADYWCRRLIYAGLIFDFTPITPFDFAAFAFLYFFAIFRFLIFFFALDYFAMPFRRLFADCCLHFRCWWCRFRFLFADAAALLIDIDAFTPLLLIFAAIIFAAILLLLLSPFDAADACRRRLFYTLIFFLMIFAFTLRCHAAIVFFFLGRHVFVPVCRASIRYHTFDASLMLMLLPRPATLSMPLRRLIAASDLITLFHIVAILFRCRFLRHWYFRRCHAAVFFLALLPFSSPLLLMPVFDYAALLLAVYFRARRHFAFRLLPPLPPCFRHFAAAFASLCRCRFYFSIITCHYAATLIVYAISMPCSPFFLIFSLRYADDSPFFFACWYFLHMRRFADTPIIIRWYLPRTHYFILFMPPTPPDLPPRRFTFLRCWYATLRHAMLLITFDVAIAAFIFAFSPLYFAAISLFSSLPCCWFRFLYAMLWLLISFFAFRFFAADRHAAPLWCYLLLLIFAWFHFFIADISPLLHAATLRHIIDISPCHFLPRRRWWCFSCFAAVISPMAMLLFRLIIFHTPCCFSIMLLFDVMLIISLSFFTCCFDCYIILMRHADATLFTPFSSLSWCLADSLSLFMLMLLFRHLPPAFRFLPLFSLRLSPLLLTRRRFPRAMIDIRRDYLPLSWLFIWLQAYIFFSLRHALFFIFSPSSRLFSLLFRWRCHSLTLSSYFSPCQARHMLAYMLPCFIAPLIAAFIFIFFDYFHFLLLLIFRWCLFFISIFFIPVTATSFHAIRLSMPMISFDFLRHACLIRHDHYFFDFLSHDAIFRRCAYIFTDLLLHWFSIMPRYASLRYFAAADFIFFHFR